MQLPEGAQPWDLFKIIKIIHTDEQKQHWSCTPPVQIRMNKKYFK